MPINTMSKILSPPLMEALAGPVEKMLLNTTVSMQHDLEAYKVAVQHRRNCRAHDDVDDGGHIRI